MAAFDNDEYFEMAETFTTFLEAEALVWHALAGRWLREAIEPNSAEEIIESQALSAVSQATDDHMQCWRGEATLIRRGRSWTLGREPFVEVYTDPYSESPGR